MSSSYKVVGQRYKTTEANNKLSCRKNAVRLLRGSVLAKYLGDDILRTLSSTTVTYVIGLQTIELGE